MQDDGPRPGQQVIEVVLPTYSMNPTEVEKFYPSEAKQICERVLTGQLENATYDDESAKEWILLIGNTIKSEIKSLNIPRYKVVVQVTIGQMKDQGVSVASRCLWDISNDNYASVNYTNETLWANVMVFVIYTD
ncbi:hypothetical protein AURANDRAFT_32091 [Aureococcus anophagefferens]|jgi:hypothetical protein|uniref:Dynein light chain n=1 Tax=Aureococcus anophagefferens TaxID=44056 RepID=F0YJJ5_AURAN|nr:hypothetical protein AURANDRAFT_32091 [Aureococcus anophagefferens]EGB04664.1 hypothetical protein AURANDRAFT_32091 [Aureococcus anophagefferens]|eukprot:XP_009040579.1 hypothetical protein AURANDRAFT_32091 [Aureococcus anophagefferens]